MPAIEPIRKWIGKALSGRSLKARAARGGLWLGAFGMTENAGRLIRNMILTRLLAPEAFGVMAIVLATQAAFESLTNIGIKQAVIQNPEGTERTYLNGAWWLSAARAAALYLIAFATAPWLGRFYESPDLAPLIRIGFLSILLNGLMSPNAFVAQKRMQFRLWALAFHGGSICGLVITVVLAFFMRNVLALAIGVASEAAARCLLSHVLTPFRPGFAFDRKHLRALFTFTRGMIGLPLLYFIFMRCDVFVLGKFCSAATLGLYSMALALARTPFQVLDSLQSQIGMPVFSEIQNDKGRVNRTILHLTAMLAFLGLPGIGFVIVHGGDLLTVVYGAEYAAMAGPFSIIFSRALAMSLGVPIATVYFAIGRPGLQRTFSMVRAALVLILIVPAVRMFAVTGAASAMLIALVLALAVQVASLRRLTGLDPMAYLAVFVRPGILALAFVAEGLLLGRCLPDTPWPRLLCGALFCVPVYGLAAWLYFRGQRADQDGSVKSSTKSNENAI